MNLATLPSEIRARCLRLLLKPVVRYCLRNGHPFQDYVAESKKVFVEIAVEELKRAGGKVNASKISAVTGLNRRDTKIETEEKQEDEQSRGIISRILVHWEQSPRFCTKNGQPRVLSVEGEDSEFSKLVSKY